MLAITPGMGVGPEVTARAIAAGAASLEEAVFFGRASEVVPAFAVEGITLPVVGVEDGVQCGVLVDPGDAAGEPCEVASIRLATAACLNSTTSALVTGPIHKGRLVAGGFKHRGHTDFLGHLCGVDDPVMAFVGGDLRVALVTHHQPLMSVGASLTVDRIVRTTRIAAAALASDLGLQRPTLAVCGLNPHAGEGGLLGTEEQHTIGPAADRLRAEGLRVIGPVSAETAFLEARRGAVDLVVAMYHDQGLAPLKAVDFGRSVNWSLGLPIVRTSVDHGTADHLMGTGKASADSMVAALRLARRIVARRAVTGTR